MPRERVRIVNPAPGGNDGTSLDRARRFVRRGRARFVDGGNAIEFFSTALDAAIRRSAAQVELARLVPCALPSRTARRGESFAQPLPDGHRTWALRGVVGSH